MYPRPRRSTRILSIVTIVGLLGMSLGAGAVGVNAFGAGDEFDHLLTRVDRFLAGPPPDRATVATIIVDEEPSEPPAATPTPEPTPAVSLAPGETPAPTPEPTPEPTPTPTPVREAMDVEIASKPKAVFASQATVTWCASAGVQMTLAVLGLGDTSLELQKELQRKVRTWEAYDDSHNGDWGPSAMALALDEYGAPGYEVRAYRTRSGALRDAAKAILDTNSPVILLAWRGAHTWVMTGFRADGDPRLFKDADVSGAYILDPWYPRNSSLWGQSDPPGTFQDAAEMERNYLKWKRPEGKYPDRDDLYISVVPTIPVGR